MNNIESFDNIEQTNIIQTIASLVNALHLDVEVEDIAELLNYAYGDLIDETLKVRSDAAFGRGRRGKNWRSGKDIHAT